MNRERLLIQKSELYTIGALMGKDWFYGFSPEKGVDKSTVIYALHNLWKSKIIEQKCNGFTVDKKYKHIFDGIFGAVSALKVKENNTGRSLCGYIGKEICVIEPSEIKNDELRIFSTDTKGLIEYLIDEEYIPAMEQEMYDDGILNAAASESDGLLDIEFIVPESGEITESVSLKMHGAYHMLVLKKDGVEQRKLFTLKLLEQIIDKKR